MPEQPSYDPVGAMGGLFAPAYMSGNPESEAAVKKWQAENFAMTPAMVEATRGPSVTTTNPGVGAFRGFGGGGSTTTTPGSVDPAALKIMAQGGKYVDHRDKIAAQVLAQQSAAQPARGVMGGGGAGNPGMTYVGGGVFLPDFDTSQQGQRGGYPWGQYGPSVSS